MALKSLDEYMISRETGFLIQHEGYILAEKYDEWNQLIEQLPNFIEDETLIIRIQQMSTLSTDDISDPCLQIKAFSLLLHLTMGYVVCQQQTHQSQLNKQQKPIIIPKSLASPIMELSQKTGLLPAITHGLIVLINWKKITHQDPYVPFLSADNMDLNYKMDSCDDYRWFFTVAGQAELNMAHAICSIYHYLSNGQSDKQTVLEAIRDGLFEMTKTIGRMYERCDPYIFYHKLRKYLTFPTYGLILNDNDDSDNKTPIKLAGASAAQSTIIPVIDAFLGIEHHHTNRDFLNKMTEYMLVPHLAFLNYIKSNVKLRKSLIDVNDARTNALYNSCLDRLIEFRKRHVRLVCDYIAVPSGTKSVSEIKGTGESYLEHFLTHIIQSTEQSRLY